MPKRTTAKKGPGRPKLSAEYIRLVVRLDEVANEALDGLARLWGCTRSAALRRAVAERGAAEGVLQKRRKR